MALTKLGDYINIYDIRNKDNSLSADDVVGLSTQKEVITTKADLEGVSLSSYKLMTPNSFAYVPDTSRRGDKMSLAYNNTKNTYLVSSISIVFAVSRPDLLLSDYLFMYFNRPEFDRYSRYNSWGSARETFTWDDMCDIELSLPPLSVQQKYVDIYNAMVANQQCYERGLSDLKLTCDAYIETLKYIENKMYIGDLLKEVDNRNTDYICKRANGINITKQFMPSVASSADLKNYKLVYNNQFVYSSMQTGRDESIRIALYKGEEPIAVSPAYSILRKKYSNVLEEYIQMWFMRSEIDRLGWFMSDASIRANLDLSRFNEVQIPIPDLSIQQSIANIYNVYTTRKELNEQLKAQIKSLCPILIKGSLDEALA